MPQEWMDILGDYIVGEGTDDYSNTYIHFYAKAVPAEYWGDTDGPLKGYALLFSIQILEKSEFDKGIEDCKNNPEEDCYGWPSGQFTLAQNNKTAYVLGLLPPEGPSNFTMIGQTEEVRQDVKSGLKLLNP